MSSIACSFDSVDLSAVNGDHVRNTWAHAKPFQPRCLDWASIAAVRWMEGEDDVDTVRGKMLEHRALDRILALGTSFIERGLGPAVPNPPKAQDSAGVEKPYDHSSPNIRRGY